MSTRSRKPFTGYHASAILAGFFGVVIAVNITMAKLAIGSFGGTVVDNSYVASQNYNKWMAEADRQARLGWSVSVLRIAGGRIGLKISDRGGAVETFSVSAKAEHPLGRSPEQYMNFVSQGDGNYRSQTALPSGRWLLHIEVRRGGDRYRTRVEIQ